LWKSKPSAVSVPAFEKIVVGPVLPFPEHPVLSLKFCGQPLVIPRGRGVRRKYQHERQIIILGETDRLKIHDRRDKDDAVQTDAALEEMI